MFCYVDKNRSTSSWCQWNTKEYYILLNFVLLCIFFFIYIRGDCDLILWYQSVVSNTQIQVMVPGDMNSDSDEYGKEAFKVAIFLAKLLFCCLYLHNLGSKK